MNKFVYIALLVLLGLNSKVFGQTYSPNTNQTYTTCSGTFYDSGGAGGNYGNNQNYSVTFCSGNGLPINLNFSAFALQSGSDILNVYAGINNLAPLIGSYSATSPGVVSSSSGCITIRFSSNNTIVSTGWSAVISCGVAPLPTYNITNGSITSCSGYFSDTGGSSSNYTNNQNYTFTICPSVANNLVQMNFSSFNLENNYDFLTIYNGPNAASPILGNYTGTNSPGIVQASVSNVSGCLTFVFTSDVSFVSSGWLASFNCLAPCQTITSNLVSTNPAPNSNGVIQICPGTPVSFQGSGTFSQTGSGANYLWNYGNGVSSAGVNGSYTYNTPGTYFVNLGISLNGCSNANSINQMVQVSTQTLILTNAINQTICLGQSSNLSASAAPIPYVQNCSPPTAGNVFLPDGTGVSYTSPITVDCYSSGQLIQNASQIDDICLTIEHSYLGDLNISITCPNGQSAILKAYPGGLGAYLGCPLDDPAVGPGSSSVYCFNASASALLVNGAVTPCGVPSGNSIVPGDYLPAQPFTNLIGCPLNGQWTITITDNLALDNGYIFSWDINFNASLPGVQASFTPNVVSQGWITTPGLTTTGATTSTVTPSSVGQNCYTYSATNNFGCTTTQVQCVTVTPGVVPTFTQLGPYCQGATPGILPATSSNNITGAWTSPISTAVVGSVVYTFTPTAGQCASPATMTVVVSAAPTIATAVTNVTCTTANNGIIAVTASGPNNGYNISWTGTSTGNPVGTEIATSGGTYSINNLNAGNYTITVSNTAGCSATATAIVTQPNSLTASSSATPILCNGGTSTVTVTAAGGTGPYTGAGTFTVTAGTYTYTVTDANGCTATTTITVTQPTLLTASSSATPILCNGGTSTVTVTAAGGTGPYTGAGTFTVTAGTYTYTVTGASGCTATTTVTVAQPTPVVATISAPPILCAGATTTITVGASGGTGPYNGTGTYTVSAGTYTYTVTDANGCTSTVTITIAEPAPIALPAITHN